MTRRLSAVLALGAIPIAAWAQDPPPVSEPAVVEEEAPILAPTLLTSADVTYPLEALAERLEGDVYLVVRVDETGQVTAVTASPDSPAVFLPNAMATARSLQFSPATQGGVPVAVDVPVSFHFAPPETALPTPDDDPLEDSIEVVAKHNGPPPRVAGEFEVHPDQFRAVPRDSASKVLTLAPGFFLTQSGGAGHPEQVFLRGFDAREGQDIQFSVEGIPLNDVGNPHGHGMADLHFLVPEAISSARILEGPFDPAQGDFAVAGSADYQLGLADPGLTAGVSYGSFGSLRGMVGFRPENHPGTLFAGDVYRTEGYGDNRAGQKASAMGRIEAGDDVKVRLLGGVYGTTYDSAGLLRKEDIDSGAIDRYGTYDSRQGGTSARGFVGIGASGDDGHTTWDVMGYSVLRAMTVRSNFTGFLLDDRRQGESAHDQRGDLLEQTYAARTFGLKAHAERPWQVGDVVGGFKVGLDARFDSTDGQARRLRDADGAPYRIELDSRLNQVDIAPWFETHVKLFDQLTLRVGGRAESLNYVLKDGCAAKDLWFPGAERDDVNCPDEDRLGTRLRDSWRTASGVGLAPRTSAQWDISKKFSVTGAFGQGIRSMEATSLSDDEEAPFARIDAGEAGMVFNHEHTEWVGRERLVGFGTRVDKDLIFDESEGKNVVAGETVRWGALIDTEQHWRDLSVRASATYTYAVFGDGIPPSYAYYNSDRVAGKLIPYIPPWVVRADVSQGWRPFKSISLDHGLGISYISPRPLPQSQRSDAVFLMDLGTNVHAGPIDVGFSCTNLLGSKYALAEYNFSSYFPEVSGSEFPTRVPTRHVAPGAPRAVTLSLTFVPERLDLPKPEKTL